jgi:predicted  nucleic acid-binding Zn-ribbon protein
MNSYHVGEEVRFRTIVGHLLKGVIVGTYSVNGVYCCDIQYTTETGVINKMTQITSSQLEKIENESKVKAIDILKDRSGGQMAVSISAIQKILQKLSDLAKRNKTLTEQCTKLRGNLSTSMELLSKKQDEVAKLKEELKALKNINYGINSRGVSSVLITEIDFD